jgi:hypothetical protein
LSSKGEVLNIEEIIKNSLSENKFIYGIFTSPRLKSQYKKITARAILLRGKNYLQLEKFADTRVFHENLTYEEDTN